jgi:hypothetical protein
MAKRTHSLFALFTVLVLSYANDLQGLSKLFSIYLTARINILQVLTVVSYTVAITTLIQRTMAIVPGVLP